MASSNLIRRSGSYGNDVTDNAYRYRQDCNTGWDPDCHNPYLITTKNLTWKLDNGYFVGYDTPHYHSRKRKGELLPMTPWRKFTITGECDGGHEMTYDNGSSWINYFTTGKYFSYTNWVVTEEEVQEHFPAQIDQYVQEAASRIYSSGHDTLTFLAELTEVRKMFANTAVKILKLDFPKGWKSFSNDWLSYRYGWRTLMYDIKDIYEAVQKLNTDKTRIMKKAHGKHATDSWDEWETDSGYFGLNHVLHDRVEVSHVGSVVADVEIPTFQFNPFQTAWELIPYSFVLDWFLSVGKSIAAASFLTLQSNHYASWGVKVTVERTYQNTGFNIHDWSGTYETNGWSKAELEVRTPCSVPLLPHFTLRLNPYKILDLIGLIVQRM